MSEIEKIISSLRDLKDMFVKDFIMPIKNAIDAETPIWKLIEAASYTHEREVFFVVKGGKPIGMISIFKILKWILLRIGELKDLIGEVEFREALGLRAMDLADKIVTVPEDAGIIDVLREMVKNNVDVVGVISSDGKLIGEIDFRVIFELTLKLIHRS